MRYARSGRYLVPLDSKAAVKYFTNGLRVSHSRSGRLFSSLPRFESKEDDLPEEVSSLFATIGEPVVPAILLRDYADAGRGRTIAFLFRHESPLPSAIVKVRSLPSGGTSLRAEADAHERLQSALPPKLRTTVPEVLRFSSQKDAEVLTLSTVAGRSAFLDVQNTLRPSRFVDLHFDAAGAWLAAFHDAAADASHGDFWARNLLIDEAGRAGVVDWELFSRNASPLFDLFHFPLTYGLNWPWTRYQQLPPEPAFAKTFLASNRVSQAVRRYLRTYAAARGLTMTELHEAFRMFLAGKLTTTPAPGTAKLPWQSLATMFDRASESVFSG